MKYAKKLLKTYLAKIMKNTLWSYLIWQLYILTLGILENPMKYLWYVNESINKALGNSIQDICIFSLISPLSFAMLVNIKDHCK